MSYVKGLFLAKVLESWRETTLELENPHRLTRILEILMFFCFHKKENWFLVLHWRKRVGNKILGNKLGMEKGSKSCVTKQLSRYGMYMCMHGLSVDVIVQHRLPSGSPVTFWIFWLSWAGSPQFGMACPLKRTTSGQDENHHVFQPSYNDKDDFFFSATMRSRNTLLKHTWGHSQNNKYYVNSCCTDLLLGHHLFLYKLCAGDHSYFYFA